MARGFELYECPNCFKPVSEMHIVKVDQFGGLSEITYGCRGVLVVPKDGRKYWKVECPAISDRAKDFLLD